MVAIPAVGLYFLEPDLPYWVIASFLVVLGFGFILGNSPRLILLTFSLPLDLIATVQSIGSAIAHLGGALAYSFMLTLLEGFGRQAYVKLLKTTGLSSEEITNRILSLATANEEISLVIPPKVQTEILQDVDYFLKRAYLMGLSQTMLVIAGVCVLSAIVVYVGLRNQKNEIWRRICLRQRRKQAILADPFLERGQAGTVFRKHNQTGCSIGIGLALTVSVLLISRTLDLESEER